MATEGGVAGVSADWVVLQPGDELLSQRCCSREPVLFVSVADPKVLEAQARTKVAESPC